MKLRKLSKRILKTNAKTFGWLMGLYPAFMFFGASVRFSSDFLQARLKLPFRWYVKNGHGSIYGGAVLAVSDPFPAIMLSRKFPYTMTWTKSHAIDFLKPGRSTLYADILIEEEVIHEAKKELKMTGRYIHTFSYDFTNKDKEVIARVHSTVYMRNPRHSRYTKPRN